MISCAHHQLEARSPKPRAPAILLSANSLQLTAKATKGSV